MYTVNSYRDNNHYLYIGLAYEMLQLGQLRKYTKYNLLSYWKQIKNTSITQKKQKLNNYYTESKI